ncbi:MAG: SurA N-terminal domain-containing protein [Ancalomicrobiaceae bacterium]|nr:SurA N-terminal domain-containing protein [Ancalomicrobiaceae bacterium]
MLDVLRRGAHSWASKFVLGLIILSFVAFGITTKLTSGSGADSAIVIGSTEVSAGELDMRFRRELDMYSQQAGHPLTRQEAASFGLTAQILSDIVGSATLTESARRLGLGVSDEAVRKLIINDPAFKGPNGQYDRNYLRLVLSRNNWTEDGYVAERMAQALRQQLQNALVAGLKPPTVMLEMLNQYALEERVVQFVSVAPAALSTLADPDQAELAKFFEERKAAFKAPESRKLQVLLIDPSTVSKAEDVPDADAKAVYDQDGARYTTAERRHVLQLPFDTKEAADAAAKRIAEGATFDALAADLKLKPEDIDLGTVDQASILDPTVAEAAFKLAKPGDVSGVVAGKFRNVIVTVKEILPGQKTPFDEAKVAIKQQIAADRAEPAMRAMLKQVESLRDERQSFAEIAQKLKLEVKIVDAIDRDGKDGAGKPIVGLPEVDKLAKVAFDSDVGNQNEALVLGNGGFLFYDVVEVKPPHDRTLEEVKGDLITRWKDERVRAGLGLKTTILAARLEKGESFEDVAKAAGLELKTTEPFKRSDTPPGLTPAAVAAAFGFGEGSVTTSLGENDGRIILKVKSVNQPPFFAEAESLQKPAADFSASLRVSVQNQYLRQMQSDIGIRANQKIVSQIIGQTESLNN